MNQEISEMYERFGETKRNVSEHINVFEIPLAHGNPGDTKLRKNISL